MSELDDVLRQSFARVAEPGDPAGVAEALRARMAAGDTGTSAASSGFRSTADRLLPWIFGATLLAIAVVVGILTGVAGGSPEASIPIAEVTATAAATPTASLTPSSTATPTPTAPATETVAPVEPPAPQPATDTTAPTLTAASATPSQDICADDSYAAYYAITSTISVNAADNVGVSSVQITWNGAETGAAQMSFGSSWTYVFNPSSSTPSGTVTFTMTARDAAGNPSAAATTSVTVIDAGGCII